MNVEKAITKYQEAKNMSQTEYSEMSEVKLQDARASLLGVMSNQKLKIEADRLINLNTCTGLNLTCDINIDVYRDNITYYFNILDDNDKQVWNSDFRVEFKKTKDGIESDINSSDRHASEAGPLVAIINMGIVAEMILGKDMIWFNGDDVEALKALYIRLEAIDMILEDYRQAKADEERKAQIREDYLTKLGFRYDLTGKYFDLSEDKFELWEDYKRYQARIYVTGTTDTMVKFEAKYTRVDPETSEVVEAKTPCSFKRMNFDSFYDHIIKEDGTINEVL